MLPARRWKRLLQLCISRGHANGSALPMANRISVCRSLIVYKWRGRRGNVALFCSWKRSNWGFQLVTGSARCTVANAEGMRMGTLYLGQTKTCLPIFKCFQAKRATRQPRPLLKLKTKRLMLPACRWKRSLQLGICRGDANASTLPTANKIPICRSLIVLKRRGRRGNGALSWS